MKKKKKLGQFIKEKKVWFISSGIFMLVGIICLIVGGIITGFNIFEWLKSPYAMTMYVCLIVGVFCIVFMVIEYKRQHLGD